MEKREGESDKAAKRRMGQESEMIHKKAKMTIGPGHH
jgi:hypothetical protein